MQKTKDSSSEVVNFDPTLDKRVENIRNLVDSYMQIVTDNIKDLVPKLIMALMVNRVCDFVVSYLLFIHTKVVCCRRKIFFELRYKLTYIQQMR